METKIKNAGIIPADISDDPLVLEGLRKRFELDAAADLREDGFEVLECVAEVVPHLFSKAVMIKITARVS